MNHFFHMSIFVGRKGKFFLLLSTIVLVASVQSSLCKKNSTYGRHRISRPMQEAPILKEKYINPEGLLVFTAL